MSILLRFPPQAGPSQRRRQPPPIPSSTPCRQELDRERELLLLPGMQRPYFIEYRLDDFQTYEAVAELRRAHPRGQQPPARRPRHRPHRRLQLRLQLHARRRHRRARTRGQRPRGHPLRALDRHRRGLQERPARLLRQAGRTEALRKARPRRRTSPPPSPSSPSSRSSSSNSTKPTGRSASSKPAGLPHRPRAQRRCAARPVLDRQRARRSPSTATWSTPKAPSSATATPAMPRAQRRRAGGRRHAARPRQRHHRRPRRGTRRRRRLPPPRHRRPEEL